MVSNLNVSHGEMSHFVSFSLFEFTLFIQLGNLDFKSHENTLIYFDKKGYGVKFEYAARENNFFCFISIAWVHFSYKTEKF